MTDLGTYVELDGRPAVRFVRTYPQPIERVWQAITTPEGLARWFPSKVELELRPGGVVTYRGDPYSEDQAGRVLACDPPEYLALTWGGEELRFQLEPLADGGCRFTLFDLLDARDAAARNAAGWDVCLSELDNHLAGKPADGPHSPAATPWRPRYDAYVAAGLPAGAYIPTGPDAAPD
jgi:uncharacterized protein YndB with AHSA1/START domain